jgi:hypothetical protein
MVPTLRSFGQTSQRGEHQIELGLQLCDSSVLHLQLVFSMRKALGND